MDGILIVNKPSGMTSHDVVDLIRRIFHVRKVGHAGTLDPMARGVLVMLLGTFTKESARLSSVEKEYVATMVLGAVSDTGDGDGRVVESPGPVRVSRDEVETAAREFTGEILQVPPMYSAVKVKGVKMYELARRGIEVERAPRKIVIRSLDILECEIPRVTLKVVCSKGTYIRQLCADIGSRLGCGAYCGSLTRTRCGDHALEECVSLDALKGIPRSALERLLIAR